MQNKEIISHPCGYLPDTFFNDSYQLFHIEKEIIINQTEITTQRERSKFKNLENWEETQWINVENGDYLIRALYNMDDSVFV